ncbi:hypothetical protein CAPTEDRAFT_213318 [Capitella teleta]|uniref:Retrotransposon gag domain-containing protein n=1 Tax=Capitella teleta TaxID=283909 RepID=R7V9D7_CAPTE|nr:hypothetical protein CAPTEDRAFT_213318 [Capitella teleta]|eukprot:ELU12355.1 hypothetical protein CAPTEDRAFT_213318 [Capitella teleta]
MDLKLPGYLSLNDDIADNWRLWRQQFENYLIATETSQKSDAIRIAMLLSYIGPESLERYNNLEFSADEDKKKFDVVVQKLDTLFKGKKRSVFARYKFWALKRTETTFDEYLSHLQTAAQHVITLQNKVIQKLVFK